MERPGSPPGRRADGFGVGRGDVVAFLDKNHPACVELTLAAASLGAATAVVNFRLAVTNSTSCSTTAVPRC